MDAVALGVNGVDGITGQQKSFSGIEVINHNQIQASLC